MSKNKTQEAHFPPYRWHPAVHSKWANQHLHYVRLSFKPFDRRAVLNRIEAYLQDLGVQCYAWNELYGPIDLILRLWLRPEHHPEVFHYNLYKHLNESADTTCRIADPFHVEQIYYHWRWYDRERKIIDPIVNAVPDFSLVTGINNDTADVKSIHEAISARLLSRYHGRGEKIHFYMGMPSADGASHGKLHLPRRIVEEFRGKGKIIDLAIYTGNGIFELLLEGKVWLSNYEEISRLSNFLNGTGLHYGIKCESYLVTGSTERSFRILEHLPVTLPEAPPLPPRTLESYASEAEGQTLERKGSFWTNLDRFFSKEAKKVKDDDYCKKGPLKTIVGMLNTSGGQLVIGLLEKRDGPRDARIREQPKEYPERGDCFLVGIETEAGYKNWDRYELAMRELIDKHIQPGISGLGLLTLQAIPAGNGKSLAVITVRPGAPNELYMIENKTYVRDGNRTVPLDAKEAERHRTQRETHYLRAIAPTHK